MADPWALARVILSAGLAMLAPGQARAEVDWLQYIASHSDLIQAFGLNAAAGQEHYSRFGQAEGRSRDQFDERQYLDNYTDLRAAFGDDARVATVHFIQYGY
jgi:hypothetical protein